MRKTNCRQQEKAKDIEGRDTEKHSQTRNYRDK